MGSSAEKEPDSQESFPRQCAAQARKACVPLFMRDPSRQPKPRAVQDALELWVEGCTLAVWYFSVCSDKTLPYHKHFWVDGLRVHQSAHLTWLFAESGRWEGGGWLCSSPLVIPTWKRLLTWVTKKTPGPCRHTEISRNVDVKSCRWSRYRGLSQSLWCDKLKVESLYFSDHSEIDFFYLLLIAIFYIFYYWLLINY